jgi:low affinity Fe/Cu permease
MNKTFNAIAQWAAQAAGKGVTFSLAAILVIVWAAHWPHLQLFTNLAAGH